MPPRRLLLVASVVAALLTAPAGAQEGKSVSFNSADGVELQGTLYKSVKNASDSPCVILLHSLKADPNKGDWAGLAKTLAGKGFNVLRFDFRGHGNSTVIDPKVFFDNPVNASAFPALKRKQATKLELKDMQEVKAGYNWQLVNDIMAARVDLDKANDAGEVNTGSVYLIGATDAAPIGLLYMAVEWTRPQVISQVMGNLVTLPPDRRQVPINSDMAGRDIAGAVWLSPPPVSNSTENAMKKWVLSAAGMREKNAVLCLYGDGDPKGKAGSQFIRNEMFAAEPKDRKLQKLPYTLATEIKGSKNVGVDLLGNNLSTEKTIIEYLETLEKDRKNVTKTVNRNHKKPALILTDYFSIR
jgi:pimeloyl-ACP methyl ester carboxylesterase